MIDLGEIGMEVLIFPDASRHCVRSSGDAWLHSREEAEAFAADPANHPVYLGDVAHLCPVCEFWYLSRFEWLYGPLPKTPKQMM